MITTLVREFLSTHCGLRRGKPFHLAIDVSGGMDHDRTRRFLDELEPIINAVEPLHVVVYQFEFRLQNMTRYHGRFSARRVGIQHPGGGTDLRETFEVATNEGAEAMAVYTDGMTFVNTEWVKPRSVGYLIAQDDYTQTEVERWGKDMNGPLLAL